MKVSNEQKLNTEDLKKLEHKNISELTGSKLVKYVKSRKKQITEVK